MHSRSPSVLLVLVLAFSSLSVTVTGDTVIRSEPVELLPAGTFDNASEWSLSTNKAYSEDSAEYSVAMVADGQLSFTHDRPENYNEITAWASYSPTEHNLSIGYPDCFKPASNPVCDNDYDGDSDGGFSWSAGPTIELAGFDLSAGADYGIVNVSLAIAFRIPESLQQDSVQFIVESGGTQHLVKTYAHTMGELNHMNYNTRIFSLDEIKSWTWSELTNARILLDYVSVGEFDDTQLQIDAAGFMVKHLQPWGTFELAKASHSMSFDEFPILESDIGAGIQSDLTITTCGLENSGGTSGHWVTESLALPHGQSWGRFHPGVVGNASWVISSSNDGVEWSSASPIIDGELLQVSDEFVRFEATLLDGCIEDVRVDINDPTFTLQGEIIGETNSMVADFAKLRIALNGQEIASQSIITNGSFTMDVPVGHLLSAQGGDIDVGLSARFHWSSNGSSESIVVQVDQMDIDGGFYIEWDRDPVCEGQSDQFFDEDGGGRLLEFLYTCSDDITAAADLEISVTSSNSAILDANYVNGQVRLQPIADASGQATATISVADERQNIWTDEILVTITEVDDSPEFDELPVDLTMELNQPLSMPFSYWDRDTPSNQLDIQISPDWATFSGGELIFNPTQVGTQTVTVTVSDGNSEIIQTTSIIVTQRANLWVQSVDLMDQNTGESTVNEGGDIAVYVYVRNNGNSVAQPINIRCSVNNETIGTPQIAILEPGDINSAICDDWSRLGIQSGEVTLKIEIDWTGDIDETNEVDNLWTSTIVVNDQDSSPQESTVDKPVSSLFNEYNSLIWVAVIFLGLLAFVVLLYGPNQIRKIE